MATVRRRERLERAAQCRLGSLAAVCVNLADPHNAGAILRTAETLGLLHVYLIEEERPFQLSPSVTLGAERWLELHRYRRAEPALAALRAAGYRVYAAVPEDADLELHELPTDARLALAFGAESEGIPQDLVRETDGTFTVPAHGLARALNVSVAAGIALHHCATARRKRLGADGDLEPAELAGLIGRYLERARGSLDRMGGP